MGQWNFLYGCLLPSRDVKTLFGGRCEGVIHVDLEWLAQDFAF